MNPFEAIGNFFQAPFWRAVIYVWKALAAVVSTFSVLGIIYTFSRSLKFFPGYSTRVPDFSTAGTATKRDKIAQKNWEALLERARTATDENAGLIIVGADNVVDEVLQHIGIPGETMGDRINAVSSQLKSVNDLWEAHRIRNKIAHESGFHVSVRELGDILEKYENVLTELDVI